MAPQAVNHFKLQISIQGPVPAKSSTNSAAPQVHEHSPEATFSKTAIEKRMLSILRQAAARLTAEQRHLLITIFQIVLLPCLSIIHEHSPQRGPMRLPDGLS